MLRQSIYLAMAFFPFMFSCNIPGKNERDQTRKVAKPAIRKLSLIKYGGTYSFGDDVETGPVGTLTVYPLSPDSALFFLDVCRGAPSYNLGQRSGKMFVDDTIVTYSQYEEDLNCKLLFHFSVRQVAIETEADKDECGFGYAVSADNIYYRTSNTAPEYFIDGSGDTVTFKSLLVQH